MSIRMITMIINNNGDDHRDRIIPIIITITGDDFNANNNGKINNDDKETDYETGHYNSNPLRRSINWCRRIV